MYELYVCVYAWVICMCACMSYVYVGKRSIFPTAKVLNVPLIRQSWSKPYIKMDQFETFVTTQSFMQTAIIR